MFNHLHVQLLVCMTLVPRLLDTRGKLPDTLALLAVLIPSAPTFNQTLTDVRKDTRPSPSASDESWAGPGNEDTRLLLNLVPIWNFLQ